MIAAAFSTDQASTEAPAAPVAFGGDIPVNHANVCQVGKMVIFDPSGNLLPALQMLDNQ